MMESAIDILMSKFKVYAGVDGSSVTLSRDEFGKLVKSELPNFLQNSGDSAAIDELMRSLDKNNDGELSFMEFWQLIGHLASKHGGFDQ
ncbi:Protein S100-A11 [Oryzias melastigma]|uniref:Protein S100 n=1 Tax=Oryzias melastigma TaxID=30732 RepID=A0A3B3BL17_ORYME|nr:protein S100-A11 [Oryzias melastigma]KAF6739652.1 Protein S100-A11 [Oryzias melastigma]